MIRVQSLSHRFARTFALKNVSFELAAGEFAFLTGPSGAGKTTLLSILHGSLPLQGGAAEVVGIPLRRLSRKNLSRLRRQVGVVFQDFKIVPDRTVAANVSLPLIIQGLSGAEVNRRVDAVLHALSLRRYANELAGNLSGGEQQRVAIGRAVIAEPKLILADEPTGNLDWDLAWRLMDVFREFNAHNTAVLMATHNRDILMSVPEATILHLEDGSIDSLLHPAKHGPELANA